MSGTNSGVPTPTNRRLAGVTSFTVDGTAYNVTEFSWSPSIRVRETMTSLSGVDGYSEKPVAGFVAAKFRDSQSIRVADFNALTGSTIVVRLANGKSVVGHGMWNIPVQEVSGAEATFDVRFEGDDVTETNIA